MSNSTKADFQARRAAVSTELAAAERNARLLPVPSMLKKASLLRSELKALEGGMVALIGAMFGF